MAYSKKVKDIEDEIRYASYSCLVTSYISSSEKAFCLFRNRDFTEKLIRILKDNEEMDVVRSHDYAHFYGKLFVQFIGLILRNEITQRTTDLRNKTKDKKKYTTSNIIREFSCLNVVKFTDGLYVDTNSLN